MGEVIAAHAVMFLEVADDGFDGGPPFELALDLRRGEIVRKRVPVNKGEEAEAVAEVAGNEFVGQNMRPGDVRRHG